jgi:hypothetical protein
MVVKITTLPNVKFWFYKSVLKKKWRKVPGGVLGGYFRGMARVRSTCRVLPKEMGWSCVIDLDLLREVVMFD